MPERPWDKFFWADWESNPKLRLCSFAAQGLWMRLLCICARSEPKGFLTVAGQALDLEGIACAVGKPTAEIEPLVQELERWRVFSRDRNGTIYSRRMVRDVKRQKEGQKHAAKRWGQEQDEGDDDGQKPLPGLDPATGGKETSLQVDTTPNAQNGRLTAKRQAPEKQDEKTGPNGVGHGVPNAHMPEARYRKKDTPNGVSKERTRGTRWPVKAEVPEEWIAWASNEEGLTDERARREARRFVDYWIGRSGQNGSKRDWFATWRNWIRRAADDLARQSQGPAGAGKAGGQRSSRSGLTGAGLRVARGLSVGGDRGDE